MSRIYSSNSGLFGDSSYSIATKDASLKQHAGFSPRAGHQGNFSRVSYGINHSQAIDSQAIPATAFSMADQSPAKALLAPSSGRGAEAPDQHLTPYFPPDSGSSLPVDVTADDVEYASHVIPFNLSLGAELLNRAPAPAAGGSEAVRPQALNRDNMGKLASELSDYAAGLNRRLMSLFQSQNKTLGKRLAQVSSAPSTIMLFELQKRTLTLAGAAASSGGKPDTVTSAKDPFTPNNKSHLAGQQSSQDRSTQQIVEDKEKELFAKLKKMLLVPVA